MQEGPRCDSEALIPEVKLSGSFQYVHALDTGSIIELSHREKLQSFNTKIA